MDVWVSDVVDTPQCGQVLSSLTTWLEQVGHGISFWEMTAPVRASLSVHHKARLCHQALGLCRLQREPIALFGNTKALFEHLFAFGAGGVE